MLPGFVVNLFNNMFATNMSIYFDVHYKPLSITDDTRVTPDEFTDVWVNVFKMGGTDEAQTLFTRADENDDGVIDIKDIPAIFSFFDENGKQPCVQLPLTVTHVSKRLQTILFCIPVVLPC